LLLSGEGDAESLGQAVDAQLAHQIRAVNLDRARADAQIVGDRLVGETLGKAVENVALVTEIPTNPMAPEDALGLVKLEARLDHFPAQMSGGEQQRVAIARAIAKRPSVLLCDEPTGALDISTGIVVLEALQRVNTELGTTTVVITHNAAIASMADRVVRLADGRVTAVENRTEKLSPQELTW